MDFVVHSVIGSPSGRAVLMTLEEKGASYRLIPLAPGTAKHPEHLVRHPFGRVPVLDHGDFSLYETQAIVRYLDRILPIPALTPTDPRRAARMDQAMNVNDWYLFQGVSNVIVFQRLVGPMVFGRQPDEALIDAAMPKARIVFRELGRLLGDQPYFAGDDVTLADLMLAPQLDFFALTPEWTELGVPEGNLVAWLQRMAARPAMQATAPERLRANAGGSRAVH